MNDRNTKGIDKRINIINRGNNKKRNDRNRKGLIDNKRQHQRNDRNNKTNNIMMKAN